MKILTVTTELNNCFHCCHCHRCTTLSIHHRRCAAKSKVGRMIKRMYPIPKWCPLPDAPEDKRVLCACCNMPIQQDHVAGVLGERQDYWYCDKPECVQAMGDKRDG